MLGPSKKNPATPSTIIDPDPENLEPLSPPVESTGRKRGGVSSLFADRGSSNKNKSTTDAKPKGKLDSSTILSREEEETFIQALIETSGLLDQGFWFLGLDTDPDIPDYDGNPGVPIWQLNEEEAGKLLATLKTQIPVHPQVIKMIRGVNEKFALFQTGMIVGSRLVDTVMQLFLNGINLRFGKAKWTQEVEGRVNG